MEIFFPPLPLSPTFLLQFFGFIVILLILRIIIFKSGIYHIILYHPAWAGQIVNWDNWSKSVGEIVDNVYKWG